MPKRFGQPVYQGQLAQELAERLNTSERFARGILSAVWATVETHLLAGRRVPVRGFGEFHCKRVGAKTMRVGFQNSRVAEIPPHRVPAWTPTVEFKRRMVAFDSGKGAADGA